MPRKNKIEDILGRVEKQGDGCWKWVGSVRSGGYGQVSFNGERWLVHRLVYSLLKGPITEGQQLDHQCHTSDCKVAPCPHRRCCNPDHLKPSTCKDNLNRGRHAQKEKTHCPAGHAYTGANLGQRHGGRRCLECHRQRELDRGRKQSRYTGTRVRKTHCKNGHPLEGANIYTFPNGSRRCRICHRLWEKGSRGATLTKNSDRTHCPKGHPYAGDNLYVSKTGRRHCRDCGRESARKHYWKTKEV